MVLFVAQVFGIHLDLGQQLTLLLLAVLGAVAAAGIPGGSLPIIAGLLITVVFGGSFLPIFLMGPKMMSGKGI